MRVNMRAVISLVAFAVIWSSVESKTSAPQVNVYSHEPGALGKPNTLICDVKGFHPPDITIELLKNGEEIPGAEQTDLAFKQGWQFHLTKSVTFTPVGDEKYSCKVTHGTRVTDYAWQPDM